MLDGEAEAEAEAAAPEVDALGSVIASDAGRGRDGRGNRVGNPTDWSFDKPENRSGCLQGFKLFVYRVWTCLEPRALLDGAKRAGLSCCQAKGWKTLRCVSLVACAKTWTGRNSLLLACQNCTEGKGTGP